MHPKGMRLRKSRFTMLLVKDTKERKAGGNVMLRPQPKAPMICRYEVMIFINGCA